MTIERRPTAHEAPRSSEAPRRSIERLEAWKRANPGWRRRHAARSRLLYPEKVRARKRVLRAIRSGQLTREPCVCGRQDTQAHHPRGHDEEHALDVVFRCLPCHREEHRRMRAERRRAQKEDQ